ncbi:MAG: hypothetical protein H6817_04740 [Phycisphaerales bacterium]|nr:hypothetical protein [Phycisphaerales bacterium]
MFRKLAIAVGMAAVLAQVTSLDAAQSLLKNGSFESGSGPLAMDPMIPANWILVGNVVERSTEANLVPAGPGHALKAFQSQPVEKAYQEVPVAGGSDMVTVSVMMYTRDFDKVGGDAIAGIGLEFFNNAGSDQGSSGFDLPMTSATPANTWISATVGPILAPAGATKARISCLWSSNSGSGAAFWDDAKLTLNGNPTNLLLNGDFEIAGVGEQSPTGIDNWAGFNDQEQSGDYALDGAKSLKVGTDSSFSGLYQTASNYTVSEGDLLLLKARVYQTSTNGLTSDARAGIKLEFSGTGSVNLPSPYENLAFDENSPTDAWTLVDLGTDGLTVPTGASLARITLIYLPDGTGPNGIAYFDAAHAEVASNPGVNLLLNAHFENGSGRPDNWTFFETAGTSDAIQGSFSINGYPDEFGEAYGECSGDAVAGFYQNVLVNEGDVLNAHVYMQMTSGSPLVGTSKAGIKIEWIGGTVPGQVDITGSASDNTITSASPVNTWIPLKIEFEMPVNTEAHPRMVAIGASGTMGSGEVFFDNFEMVVLNRFDGADVDADDDEDLADYAAFQRCFPGGSLGWNCTVFDQDDSLDIDLADFDFFVTKLTGP